MSENKLNKTEVFAQNTEETELEQVSGGAAGYNYCRYGYIAPVQREEPKPEMNREEQVQPQTQPQPFLTEAELPKNLKLPEASGKKLD
ncbi:MAG: hypothetical protein J6D38_01525 [Solobacterium sp.]|nr:hypothetical protein [Solobacterium sp.]